MQKKKSTEEEERSNGEELRSDGGRDQQQRRATAEEISGAEPVEILRADQERRRKRSAAGEERGRDQQRRVEEISDGGRLAPEVGRDPAGLCAVLSAEEISAARHWTEAAAEIRRDGWTDEAGSVEEISGGSCRDLSSSERLQPCNRWTDAGRRVARLPGVKMSNF